MSAGLDASTVTPGSTAPDASFTAPVMTACASAAAGTNNANPTAARTFASKRIVSSRFSRDTTNLNVLTYLGEHGGRKYSTDRNKTQDPALLLIDGAKIVLQA